MDSSPSYEEFSIDYWKDEYVKKLDDIYNHLSRKFEGKRKEIRRRLSIEPNKAEKKALKLELEYWEADEEIRNKL